MPIIIVFFVIVFVFSLVSAIKKTKEGENNTKSDLRENRTSYLEHTSCNNDTDKNCFHEYISNNDYKVCKNCGYENDKKATKCSVCGKRLF